MPPSPIANFSRLSLDSSMPPSARPSGGYRSARTVGRAEESSDETRSDSGGSRIDDDFYDKSPEIAAPSSFKYKVDHLKKGPQATARATFRTPPDLTIEACRLLDNQCAFQMTERVKRSIRIYKTGTNREMIECSCAGSSRSCEHVFWLMDQLIEHTLYYHDPGQPLTLTDQGFAREMGDPYEHIARFNLDVLAESLHCDVMKVDSSGDEERKLNPRRVRDAREILGAAQYHPQDQTASLSSFLEKYRRDIFENPRVGKKTIKRGDLECTVFRMLMKNREFFHYFMKQERSSDPINNIFNKLSQRLTRVFKELDEYCQRWSSEPAVAVAAAAAAAASSSAPASDFPCDVAWVAHHITGVVGIIHANIFSPVRDRPLTDAERLSAARLLLTILREAFSRNHDLHPGPSRRDRNLFFRLIGDQDTGFILVELDGLGHVLRDENMIDNLSIYQRQFVQAGVPASYCDRMARLIAQLQDHRQSSASSSAAGSKRSGQGGGGPGRGPKRVK